MNNDWNSNVWRPPSDNSSYFSNINKDVVEKLREQINNEVRNEANQVIHKIVTDKDSEIEKLKQELEKASSRIEEKQKQIDSLRREKRHFVIPETPQFVAEESLENVIQADIDTFTDELIKIIKFGKTEKSFSETNVEKIRKILFIWKKFLEEYKWKSNYISVKIKKLLKDTDSIL